MKNLTGENQPCFPDRPFRAPSIFQLSLVTSALKRPQYAASIQPPCSLLENRESVDACVCCEKKTQ